MLSYHRIVSLAMLLVVPRGNCSGLTATFGNGEYVSCTSPPTLTVYIYGYIQCQRACIRHSNCAWIRYVKEYLACSFYLDGDCAPDATGNVKYLKRTEIDEKIGGSCVSSGCQADTVCVHLHDGIPKCVQDKEMMSESEVKVSYVHFDGLVFSLFRKWAAQDNAAQTCHSSSGRLAVIDTRRKQHFLVTAILDIKDTSHWWVDRAFNSTAYLTPDALCVLLGYGSGAVKGDCTDWYYFVCELT